MAPDVVVRWESCRECSIPPVGELEPERRQWEQAAEERVAASMRLLEYSSRSLAQPASGQSLSVRVVVAVVVVAAQPESYPGFSIHSPPARARAAERAEQRRLGWDRG